LPDSNFIFFVATKKTKQKKALRCAGHVWLVKAATSIRNVLVEQNPTLPPQVTRLLRASPFVENCNGGHAFKLFPCRLHPKEGPPVTGRLLEQCYLLMPRKFGKGDALRKERALLHTFVAGQKYGVGRDSTRRFSPSNLFHEPRFQLHRTDTVDFAVDIVIAIDQANIPDLCANLNDQGGTFHL